MSVKAGEVKHYLNWIYGLKSETAAPLQVCYRLDGNTKLEQESFRPHRISRWVTISRSASSKAFLPCVWHVQVLAKAGRCDEAEAECAHIGLIARGWRR